MKATAVALALAAATVTDAEFIAAGRCITADFIIADRAVSNWSALVRHACANEARVNLLAEMVNAAPVAFRKSMISNARKILSDVVEGWTLTQRKDEAGNITASVTRYSKTEAEARATAAKIMRDAKTAAAAEARTAEHEANTANAAVAKTVAEIGAGPELASLVADGRILRGILSELDTDLDGLLAVLGLAEPVAAPAAPVAVAA